MKKELKNLIISLLLSTLGTTFLIYYIFRASVDVVASDYIRIINFYLEDVTDLHYLLSWEGISRIPFTFLARFINVKLFKYSVFFDKILGTLGLFLFNTVVVSFVLENLKTKLMKIIASITITYISFSLMAWEMILNGTGYAHFITVGLIALTFKIFSCTVGAGTNAAHTVRGDDGNDHAAHIVRGDDAVGADIIRPHMGEFCEPASIGASYTSPSLRKKIICLCLLIPFTSILFAASYAVSYNLTIVLFDVIFLLYGIISDKISRTKDLKSELIDEHNNKRELKLSGLEKNVKYFNQSDKRQCYIKKLELLCLIVIPIICLLLYFKSNSTGEALIPIGFKDISLVELLKTDPLFPVRFLLKSLASSIIGVETLEYAINFNTISEKIIFFIGFLYLIVIIYAIIILIIKIHKLYCSSVGAAHAVRGDEAHKVRGDEDYIVRGDVWASYASPVKSDADAAHKVRGDDVGADTIRPRMGELCEPAHISGDTSYLIFVSMVFIYGIANYLLVFLARYKFVVDSYGMTSRYSLQYMFLTLGIIMILIKFLDDHAAHIVRGDETHAVRGDETHAVCGDDAHTTLGDDGNDHAAHTVRGDDGNDYAAHIAPQECFVALRSLHSLRKRSGVLGDVVGAKHCEPVVVAKHCEPVVGASYTSPKKLFLIIASILSLSFIMIGHLTTNTDEIFKADYRKIIYSIVEDKAKNYKNLSDEDLENSFEYHRGPEQIRHAFEILENQNLNIFK